MQSPQMQTPVITHTLDTSPMDINQSQPRPKTCTCYNCSDEGHLSCVCLKLWKQRIQSAKSAEGDIKSIIAKAVAAAMDARELANKAEEAKCIWRKPKRIFRLVNGETHTP